jgi:outer membrane biosynthesis protein TonB
MRVRISTIAMMLLVVAAVAASGGVSAADSLSREQVDRVVKKRAAAYRACFQRGLEKAPGLHGKVVVTFTIDGEGKVTKTGVGRGSSLNNAAVETCIRYQISKLVFPKAGSEIIVSYPLFFELAS